MSKSSIAVIAIAALAYTAAYMHYGKQTQIPDAAGTVVKAVAPKVVKPHETPAQIKKKKSRFFAQLIKPAKRENTAIEKHRGVLEKILSRIDDPSHFEPSQHRGLSALLQHYRLEDSELQGAELLAELQKRIDIIPVSLILAQAANESAWGTSRFAKEGNNYFGQWCFVEGCGIVPAGRDDGKVHEVARFDSIGDSVRSYIRNLNTHPAYEEFRELRAQLRSEGKPVTGEALANGLLPYSQRGQHYVDVLKAMIRVNNLAEYDEQLSAIDVATADSDLDESTALKTKSTAL